MSKRKKKKQKKKSFIQKFIENRLIVRQRLPVGVIAVLGRQGVGKTSSACAMFCNDYKYHNKERMQECREFTNNLNENGYNLHLEKHNYFSNTTFVLDNKKGITTWELDVSILGLPNLDYEVQYFPLGSVLFLGEFDQLVGCRDWETLTPYIIALAKYCRHWGLTIILDMQSFNRLDKAWRELVMYTLFWFESYDTRKILWFKPKRKWKGIWVDNQLNNFVKDLSSMISDNKQVEKLSKKCVQNYKYLFKGNIFERYDSYSGKAYFLYKIKDYVYKKPVMFDYSPESVEKYCELHPLVRPKEMEKRKK